MYARSRASESGAHSAPPGSARARPFFSPIVQAKCAACAEQEGLQPKLVVGSPGDRYEQEADRAADAVMRAAAPGAVSDPGGHVPTLQRLSPPAARVGPVRRDAGDLESRIDASRGTGSPLPEGARDFMESRFGYDFSGVRVHTGTASEHLNRDVRSRAFTSGADIYFGAGEYRPDTDGGRHLLAHELTHVVQQSSGTAPPVQRQGIDQAALDQCIAEQGGSPGYRDGGLASPEELERYRQECLRRQSTSGRSDSRAIENLGRAWEYAQERLGPEIRNEVENLFSPASLAAMAAFAVLFIAAQATPVGWVADAFALTLLTLTVILVGALVFEIARDLVRFFSAVNATTEDELRDAGHALARALARGGVGLLVALLTRGMGRGVGRPPTPTAPATAVVEVVGVGRMRVPIRASTAAEAVDASRLQQLASYAVMVPPPGGASPGSPSQSSSGGGGGGEPGRTEGGGRGTGEPGRTEGGGRGTGGGPAVFRIGRIPYGEGALSQLAQRLRLALGLRRGGNVAVFEFESIPDAFRRLVARLGGRNVQFEGNRMAVQNVSGSAHSEQLAHELIQAGRRQGMELNVREIYTEYNPCTDTCLPLIQRSYPSARVTFSFIWELWGRQTPDRNAAVDALFSGAEQGTR